MSFACTWRKVDWATALQGVSTRVRRPPATVSFHCTREGVSKRGHEEWEVRTFDLTPSATPVRVGMGAGKEAGGGGRE